MKITLPPITPGDWTAREGDVFNPDRPWGVVRLFSMEENREIDGDDAEENSRSEVIAEVMSGPTEEADAVAMASVPALLRALSECVAWIDSVAETKPEDLQAYLDNSLEHVEGRCNYALTLAGCVIEP